MLAIVELEDGARLPAGDHSLHLAGDAFGIQAGEPGRVRLATLDGRMFLRGCACSGFGQVAIQQRHLRRGQPDFLQLRGTQALLDADIGTLRQRDAGDRKQHHQPQDSVLRRHACHAPRRMRQVCDACMTVSRRQPRRRARNGMSRRRR